MRKLLLLFSALLACAGVMTAATPRMADVPYTKKTDAYSRERLKLDVYAPDSLKDAPVLVWFHGGGLTSGDKRVIPPMLTDAPMVVISANYRLIPNVSVKECIDDAAEAVAWAFENAGRLGGSSQKVFVTGHSAGGFLTSMVGLDKERLKPYGVDADSIAGLIPLSGQVITHFADRKSMGVDELTPMVDKNAPLFHVRKDAPPYVIITGDAERELLGRYEENLYMWRMMRLTGHPYTRIYKLDGYDHGSMAWPAIPILRNEMEAILKNRQ